MQRAVIFDLDGVLVDSYQAHYDSWQRLCQQWDLTMTEPQFASTFGRTTREVVAQFWSARAFTAAQVAAIDAQKEAIYRELLRSDFPIMDGALALLDDLQRAGAVIGLGSSAPPENVWLSLERLNRREYFSAVVTGADVARGKPDPEVFLRCAQGLDVRPSSCVVIEDAPAGIAAARAAGMACVGLASRGRTQDELSAADFVVDHLGALSARSLLEPIR